MNSKSKRTFQFISSVLLYLIIFNPNFFAQSEDFGTIRAIHIGGNWGRNALQIPVQPEDYYQYLQRLNVNWAGISVALHVDNSLDDTIASDYDDNLEVPTFRDEPLRDAIRGFKQRNINVFLTLAIESQEAAGSEYPVHRIQLGDPFAYDSDPNIQPENWPWDPAHPNHEQFVQNFWNSFANEAKYFAQIAEEEGVGLFSLGAETDKLFRTRAGGPFPNHFLNEIKAVVDSVRSVFSGLVTYEIHWGALADPYTYSAGSDYLFQDLGLDAVGVSAYFKLHEPEPTSVIPVEDLKVSWRNIFNDLLTPLKDRNPDLPILFLEFGYVDALGSPFLATTDAFINKILIDNNGNGLDDGEEQQANAHESFYSVNEEFNRLVQGTFLWGNQISGDDDWNSSFGQMRTFSIRNKLAEDIVATWYEFYKPEIAVPELIFPENSSENVPIDVEFRWHSITGVDYFSCRVSEKEDFSDDYIYAPSINDTTAVFSGLLSEKTYYWQVAAITSEGMGEWSETFSFTTEPSTSTNEQTNVPYEFQLSQNYPNPFNPATLIKFTIPFRNGGSGTELVTLKVYDILGNEITTLVKKFLSAGSYEINFNADGLNSGIYIYQLRYGELASSKKMVLIK